MYTGFLRESQKSTTLGTILGRKRSAKSKQPILTIRRASCFGSCTPAGYPPARGAPPATRGPSATHFPATSRSVRRAKKSCKRQKTRFPFCWHHRENQSAEAAAINTVCKPRSHPLASLTRLCRFFIHLCPSWSICAICFRNGTDGLSSAKEPF